MNHFKRRLLIVTAFALIAGLTVSCSKDDDPVVPVDPVDPTENPITLTQLSASLSEPTAVTRASNAEGPNVIKTAFGEGDFFSFAYNAFETGDQVAYAHTTDGKTWVLRKTADASSVVQAVKLANANPILKATYLPLAAAGATDGIVLDEDNMLVCYDALTASGTATVLGESATASLKFTHVNHLLRFSVSGDASVADVDHLLLTVSYKDAAGKQQTSLLKTVLHTEYTAAEGNKQNVIQAIVPRESLLKGVTVVFSSGKILVVNDPEHSSADLACPGGKSRLISLTVSDDQLTMQPGDISAGWVDGGTINSDEKLADAIYISTANELKAFRDAVNANPESSAAKINGILAYTANVVQTADIDLSAENWTPIGGAQYNDNFDVTSFKGTYNGNGYTISNMTVIYATTTGNGAAHYSGLFGRVESPKDKNAVLVGIHLRNASIQVGVTLNQYYVVLFAGALVGQISGNETYPGVISLCSATGSVNVSSADGLVNAGGLVGNALNTHVTRCTVKVPTTATGKQTTSAGGVVGYAKSSMIVSCYAQESVEITQMTNTTANAGGVAGDVNDGSSLIMACRADGNVTATGQSVNAGGLVGAGIGTLAGSFAKGTVTGNASGTGRVGAIIGNNFSPNRLALCYGASANDAGTSRNAAPAAANVVYKATPAIGEILSVIDGSAWAAAHGGTHKAETVIGGILTPVSLFVSGQYTTNLRPRLWVLFDDNPPWSTTLQGGTDVYPAPVMSYTGQ